jgi:hypothetical protein
MWNKIILGVGCAGLVLSCLHGSFTEGEITQAAEFEVNAAVESARAWLKIMDEGRYEQCWETAGTDFKERLTSKFTREEAAKAWELMLKKNVEYFGNVISRKLREKRYYNSVPNFPGGEYFLFTFDVVYKSKDSTNEAEEVVSVKKEKDGQWRLNSYIIGPTDKQRELMMKEYKKELNKEK